MKTMTPRSDAPATPSRPRLRRLCAAAVVVPALALAACSGESPASTPGASAASTPGSSGTTSATSSATTASATPSATATPTPTPTTTAPSPSSLPRTNTAVSKVFADRGLGHGVTVGTISRNVPWPKGNPVSEAAFEIVGVYVKVRAGARYSATIEPGMFALATADPSLVEPATQFGSTLGKPLAVATRGMTTDGWLFFKVDRGAKTPFTLYLRRPAYSVSTTGASLPATRYGVTITK